MLTIGGAAAAQAAPTPVPGPKVPIEHVGVSGTHFSTRSGTPGCFSGAGSVHHGYEVPRGATIIGLTAYVVDTLPNKSISVELSRHNFASGGTYVLAKGNSIDGYDTTIDLKVDPGYVLATGEGVNVVVTVSGGVCFKGAELHYLGPGENSSPDSVSRQAPETDVAPDGTDR